MRSIIKKKLAIIILLLFIIALFCVEGVNLLALYNLKNDALATGLKLKESLNNSQWGRADIYYNHLDDDLGKIVKIANKMLFADKVPSIATKINQVKTISLVNDQISPEVKRIIKILSQANSYKDLSQESKISLWQNVQKISLELNSNLIALRESKLSIDDYVWLINIASISPQIFGVNQESNWLVYFQNETEIRPTGGLWGALVDLEFKNGTPVVGSSFPIGGIFDPKNYDQIIPLDIKNIVETHTKKPIGMEFVNGFSNFNDVTNVSTPIIESQRNKKYILSIGVDIKAIAKLLELVGPVDVKTIGEVDSKNIYQKLVYEPYFKDASSEIRSQRKLQLGEAGSQLINKLFSKDPSQIIAWIMQSRQDQHLLFSSTTDKYKQIISSLNSKKSDVENPNYVIYEETNFGGKQSQLINRLIKITRSQGNRYLVKIDYDYFDTDTGAKLEFQENKTLVRIRVPNGSKLIQSTGYQVGGNQINVLNDNAFSNVLIINPGEKKSIQFEYQLSDTFTEVLKQYPDPQIIIQPGLVVTQE